MMDPGLALAVGLAASTFTLFLAIIAVGGTLRWGLRRRPAKVDDENHSVDVGDRKRTVPRNQRPMASYRKRHGLPDHSSTSRNSVDADSGCGLDHPRTVDVIHDALDPLPDHIETDA